MKIPLIILAAGLGKRFGKKVKQLTPIGPNDELLLEYSINDAIKAGFNQIILVIRNDIEDELKSILEPKFADKIELTYVFQTPDTTTNKLHGTAHALYCCKNIIESNFAIINADDYYGTNSFIKLKQFLDKPSADACIIGYPLINTLSDNGPVNRGICKLKNGILLNIKETRGIKKSSHNANLIEDGDGNAIESNTIVSMNMWGFTPNILKLIDSQMADFIKNNPDDELTITAVVENAIKNNNYNVRTTHTPEKWIGITYEEDVDAARNAILKRDDNVIVYNKLVRDKIPEVIESEHKSVEYKILSDEEYKVALNKKLHEEYEEFEQDESLEELADMLEVIYAIAATKNCSEERLNDMRDRKARNKGTFKKKIYLKTVRN